MKVFLSWSKPRSQKIAEALHGWLPSVLQYVKPFCSTDSVRKGAAWFPTICQELDQADAGIICCTPENRTEPWLLFEAGAIAKRLSPDLHSCCTLLIGMNSANDLQPPLSLFQATMPNREDIWRLVRDLNSRQGDGDRQLPPARLDSTFEMWWPQLESQFTSIASVPVDEPKEERTEESKVDEALGILREMMKLIPSRADSHGAKRNVPIELELDSVLPQPMIIDDVGRRAIERWQNQNRMKFKTRVRCFDPKLGQIVTREIIDPDPGSLDAGPG